MSRARTGRVHPSTHSLQAHTCPAAAHNFHCWEVPRTSNPNTSSCRTSFGLSLSARVQACLQQDRAVPTPAGQCSLAHEARGLGKPGLKFVLLCNHSGGLSQFRLASVSLLVQWAGKGSQHRTSGRPLGAWGDRPVCSQLGPASP